MYVAPIKHQMHLRFDLLRDPCESVQNMSKAQLYFYGMRISLDVHLSDSPLVSKLRCLKDRLFPIFCSMSSCNRVLFLGSGLRDNSLALLLDFIILQREKNPPVLSDTLQGRLLYWF
jgi:hypothetical protein